MYQLNSEDCCQSEKILLRSLTLKIQGEVDTDVLLGKNKDTRAGFTSIDVYVKIEADMSPAEKKAFLHEVDLRCPVSGNIMHATPVSIHVQE